MIGVGLSIVQLAVRQLLGGTFSPIDLFTTGVTGAWYDPSDINLTWRRNLLTYSEQFDNAAWSKVSSAVSVNQITAPDGATTADFMVETATTAEHLILQSQALSWGAGSKVVGSVYAKSGGRRYIRLLIGGSTTGWNAYCVFDLIAASTGSPSANGAAVVSRSITDVGNGWYRCELVATPAVSSSSGAVIQFNTMLSMDANASNYTGDGTSGIYIWGAQLEQGSTATPYQRITDGIQDYLQYQAQPVLYRDAAGTTPVTGVEQPVGLMLDKSKGLVLGPELVTNGDFATDTWWSKDIGVSIAGGQCVFTSVTTNRGVYRSGLTTAGKYYSVTYTITVNSGAIRIIASGASGANRTASGTYIEVIGGTSGTLFGLFANPSFDGTVDNVSVRELPGNHAFNPSGNSANFPVLSARKNKLLATAALATQNVTVRAVGHVLSFWGTGTITLSGASTAGPLVGTGAGNRVYLEFTPTAGTLTLTVSGSVLKAQLEEINETV